MEGVFHFRLSVLWPIVLWMSPIREYLGQLRFFLLVSPLRFYISALLMRGRRYPFLGHRPLFLVRRERFCSQRRSLLCRLLLFPSGIWRWLSRTRLCRSRWGACRLVRRLTRLCMRLFVPDRRNVLREWVNVFRRWNTLMCVRFDYRRLCCIPIGSAWFCQVRWRVG